MNLFLYVSAIALSFLSEAFLSPAFILNLMQFSVHSSLEIIPCLIAFLFPDFVSVACKYVKIVYAQYLIPFKLDCQFLYDSPAYVTHYVTHFSGQQ